MSWPDFCGLEVTAVFTRETSMFGESKTVVRLSLRNTDATQRISRIRMSGKQVPRGMTLKAFPEIAAVLPGTTMHAKVHAGFNGKEEAIKFSLQTNRGRYPISLKAPLGELLRPVVMSETMFTQRQGEMSGMQEANCEVTVKLDPRSFKQIPKQVLRNANVGITVGSANWLQTGKCRFVGRRSGSQNPMLFSVEVSPTTGAGKVRVNCESAMSATTFLRTLRDAVLE